MSFSSIAPLLEMEGAKFFSLQLGDARLELGSSNSSSIIDLANNLRNFGDTAAVIAQLDLVISVDTSVLHLAGALGKPVWGLMSQPTGFLWMNERTDSPWYPSMRLFRQETPGDWKPVITEVTDALNERVADKLIK